MLVRRVLSGNEASALAAKMARAQVIAAYPITPQTKIVEYLAEMVESGEADAEMIRVESEHSALAAAYGAAVAGVRAYTATSSHGLLYMHEMVWWVAASRIPLVMTVVTRAIGPPWNIWSDHQDIMDQRDTGWIIAMAMNVQEAFDLTLQAFRISEDERVFLPMMVGLDAFLLSHTKSTVLIPEQTDVDNWLPERRQPYVVDPKSRLQVGSIMRAEDFMRLRAEIDKAMERARYVVKEVGRSYTETFGTGIDYSSPVEEYRLKDAKYAVVLMGAWAGDAMEAVDRLRERYNVGVLRIRYVRPWPADGIKEALSNMRGVLVLDRSVSFGRGGHLYTEILADVGDRVKAIKGVVAGIGGVQLSVEEMEKLIEEFINEVDEVGEFKYETWYCPWEGVG